MQAAFREFVVMFIWSMYFALTNCECPFGYIHHQDSCYFFSTDTMDWYRAEERCRLHNARLAEVDNKQTSDFLIAEANRLGDGVNGYWLGGRDHIIEGVWRWDHSNRLFSYTAWAAGEPINGRGGDGNEDCLDLHRDLNMLWNDAPCSFTRNKYICETPYNNNEGGEISFSLVN